jgi:hypothetical protein
MHAVLHVERLEDRCCLAELSPAARLACIEELKRILTRRLAPAPAAQHRPLADHLVHAEHGPQRRPPQPPPVPPPTLARPRHRPLVDEVRLFDEKIWCLPDTLKDATKLD